MQKSGKLELTWAGKYEQYELEPRILLEDRKKSYGDKNTGNMLIHGDNLLALKALEKDFAGQVKCIYIDPPYNTGSAFEHYDDGLEHSIWLGLMRDRLELLKKLLSNGGFIFVQIDNNEMAYLKVVMDEVFGRQCFINDIIWKRRGGSANPNNRLNNVTDYILWYSKTTDYQINFIYSEEDENTQQYIQERFTNEIDGKIFMLAPIERNRKLGMRETLRYEYKGYIPQYGWMMSFEKLVELDKNNRLHWNGKNRPNRRVFLEDYQGQPIGNLWTDIKVINPMSKERLEFDGQKPETLIERVLTLTTNPGDLVLDSFLGSGTTAAVAHKMNRKYIGIELGEHAYTHCKRRLDKVIDGEEGGISKALSWKGGGGYKFYELAPSLLQKHSVLPVYQINKEYNFEMLCEAICKIEGFTYKPEGEMHGHSSERRFIHISKDFVSGGYITKIMKEVGKNQSLLIYGIKLQSGLRLPDNVEVKRIPKDLLKKCKFESEVR